MKSILFAMVLLSSLMAQSETKSKIEPTLCTAYVGQSLERMEMVTDLPAKDCKQNAVLEDGRKVLALGDFYSESTKASKAQEQPELTGEIYCRAQITIEISGKKNGIVKVTTQKTWIEIPEAHCQRDLDLFKNGGTTESGFFIRQIGDLIITDYYNRPVRPEDKEYSDSSGR